MIAIMSQVEEPYGHLVFVKDGVKDGAKDILAPILPGVLARMVGASEEEVIRYLAELESFGVFSRTSDGIIYSRRMVRDEEVRQTRASGGVQSQLHPNVPKKKDVTKDTGAGDGRISFRGSLGGSPAFASASASAKEETLTPPSAAPRKGTRLPEDFTPDESHRKLAQELGLSIEKELPKFRDYWRAVSGAKGTKLDWPATLRNWLRTAAERNGGVKSQPKTVYATVETSRPSVEPEVRTPSPVSNAHSTAPTVSAGVDEQKVIAKATADGRADEPQRGDSTGSTPQLIDDFAVTDEHRQFARNHGLPDADGEIDGFKVFWRWKLKGAPNVRDDWSKQFEAWLKSRPRVFGKAVLV